MGNFTGWFKKQYFITLYLCFSSSEIKDIPFPELQTLGHISLCLTRCRNLNLIESYLPSSHTKLT